MSLSQIGLYVTIFVMWQSQVYIIASLVVVVLVVLLLLLLVVVLLLQLLLVLLRLLLVVRRQRGDVVVVLVPLPVALEGVGRHEELVAAAARGRGVGGRRRGRRRGRALVGVQLGEGGALGRFRIRYHD